MVDGVLYLSMPFDHVAAIDARSGRELWRYEHQHHVLRPGQPGPGVSCRQGLHRTVDAWQK